MLELETLENREYAASLGISEEMVQQAAEDVRSMRTSLADLAGFTPSEIEALHQHGMHLLQRGDFTQAGEIFFSLVVLKPREARFYRAVGMVFHHQRNFGWARQYYYIAHRLDEQDVIAMALLGEAQLYTGGKRFAHGWLTKALTAPSTLPEAQPFLMRAKSILSKIVL